MAQKEIYYRAEIRYENVSPIWQHVLGEEYMKNRNKVVDIFNERIGAVNEAWERTGKPAAFGDYAEDINPEYTQFVNAAIQPAIDVLNESLHIVKYRLGEYCDIEGYDPLLKGSRIWVVMYPA